MKNQSCVGHGVMSFVMVLALSGLAACGGDSESVPSGPGESCAKTSDCESGYECIDQVCHQPGANCPADKDCSGLECGPDPVCGESCGTCGGNEICQEGRCVSGSSGDTWKDPASGLTWQVTPTGEFMTWPNAKTHCANLSLDGGGWHLPTIGELRSLTRGCPATEAGGSCNIREGDCLARSCRNDSCIGCSTLEGPGKGGMYWPYEIEGGCCWYWSSTPVEDHTTVGPAWAVDFHAGGAVDAYSGVASDTRVRCVR